MMLLLLMAAGAAAPNAGGESRDRKVPTVQGSLEEKKVKIAGPQVKMNDVRLETAWKMDDVRVRQLAMIEEMLELEVEDERYAQLLFRKAELLHERARYYTFSAGSTEDKAFEHENAGRKMEAEAVRKQVLEFKKKSKRAQRSAIRAYVRIIEDLPGYERLPEVLHALGQAWWEIDAKELALDTYTRIIREFPESAFVPDAYLSFGEYYFDNMDLENALKAYGKAASFKASKVRPFAEYKKAWTLYNLNDFRAASEGFALVVKLGQEAEANGQGGGKFSLGREARRDYVSAYSHFGRGETALSDLEALDLEHSRSMANRLADIWLGSGKDEQVSALLDRLIAKGPTDPLLPSYYAKRMRALLRHGDRPRLLASLKEMASVLKKPSGGDMAAQKLRARAMSEADLGLRQIATRWHSDGAKSKSKPLMQDAAKVYDIFIDLMADSPHRHEIAFYSGELLFGLKRFGDAALRYRSAVELNRKGPFAADAALEMVRSYDALIATAEEKGGADAKAEIKAVSAQMMAACHLYLELAPNGKLAPVARYRIADSLYAQERFDEALAAFTIIVDQAAGTDLGEVAADQVLDVLQSKKDWRGLFQRSRDYSQDPRFAAFPEFQQRAAKIADQTGFKVLSLSMADLPHEDVARGFGNYVQTNPTSDYADEAMFNAAVYWEKAGRNDFALQTREAFVKRFPDSEHTPRTYFNLANVHRKTCNYEAAADQLERFATSNPNDELTAPAWLDASVYRQELGQMETALKDRRAYLKALGRAKEPPSAKMVAKVRLSVGKMIAELKGDTEAARFYDRLAPQLEDVGAKLVARGRAAAHWRNVTSRSRWATDGRKAAEAKLRKAIEAAEAAKIRLKGEAADLVAGAQLAALEPRLAAFTSMKLPSSRDQAAFAKAFGEAQKELGELKLELVSVAGVGSTKQAVVALRRMGDLPASFGKKILAVKAPPGLSEEAANVFRDALSDQAIPYTEAAAEHYNTCVTKARGWGITDDNTKACLDFLVKNRSDQFPQLDEEHPSSDRSWISGYSPLGSLRVRKDDLAHLRDKQMTVAAQKPKAVAKPVAKKKDKIGGEAPAKAEAKPAAKDETPANAEEAMAKEIRDDGTIATEEGDLFEEEEQMRKLSPLLLFAVACASAPKGPVVDAPKRVDPRQAELAPFLDAIENDEDAAEEEGRDARRRLLAGRMLLADRGLADVLLAASELGEPEVLKAVLLARRGDFSAALAAARRAGGEEGLRLSVAILLAAGESEQARQAIEAEADSSTAKVLGAWLLHLEADSEGALKRLRDHLFNQGRDLFAYLTLARIHMELGQLALARLVCREGLKHEPGHADLSYMLGRIEQLRGRPVAAQRAFDKALKSDPGHLGALLESAKSHLAGLDYQAAFALTLRAFRLAPADGEVAILHALTLRSLRRCDEAAGLLGKWTERKPLALFNLGVLKLRCQDDAKGALIDFKAFVEKSAPDQGHPVHELLAEAEMLAE